MQAHRIKHTFHTNYKALRLCTISLLRCAGNTGCMHFIPQQSTFSRDPLRTVKHTHTLRDHTPHRIKFAHRNTQKTDKKNHTSNTKPACISHTQPRILSAHSNNHNELNRVTLAARRVAPRPTQPQANARAPAPDDDALALLEHRRFSSIELTDGGRRVFLFGLRSLGCAVVWCFCVQRGAFLLSINSV